MTASEHVIASDSSDTGISVVNGVKADSADIAPGDEMSAESVVSAGAAVTGDPLLDVDFAPLGSLPNLRCDFDRLFKLFVVRKAGKWSQL